MNTPARTVEDVCNRALSAVGAGVTIGSVYDGTAVAEEFRRIYGETLRQLLRASHWAFARKRAPLQLLGDSTGQTPNVGTFSEKPWIYCYAWPVDGVCARWLPWNGLPPGAFALAGGPPIPGNIQPPNPAVPLMPNLNVPGGIAPFFREPPARFLLSSTDQYPSVVGQTDWPSLPDTYGAEGVGPIHRRVVLTNVPQAELVYTFLALEPDIWDDLFRQALVAALGSLIAMVAIKDPKEAMAQRNTQILLAKTAIREARVASDNEAGFRQSTDHEPDWLRVRRLGGFGRWGAWGGPFDSGGWGGPGMTWCGWGEMGFADGSVF
jgi:hypothetical protein